MDSHENEHGHGEGHGIHLPDPSIWPLVVGAAALVAGIALIWWSGDQDNSIAGPLLGVALAFVLAAAAGWAIEDGRMRKKAEEGHGAGPATARYSQVLTFAIPEGNLDKARSGVLSALERSELGHFDGFQDLRVTVAPATSGPTTALVETTWSGRQGLESYDATRQTLLDTITAHPEEVVPGTVQAFDMEVVKDTKDSAFRFGWGAATTVIGGLLLGGFALGAGLSLFQEESTAAGGGGGEAPAPANPYDLVARDNRFDKATLQAPPNTDVVFTLENKGKAKHNLRFLTAAGGGELAPGSVTPLLDGGTKGEAKFKTPGPGTYFFDCEVHPAEMKGTFEVKEGAPPPGGAAPAPGASPAASPTGAK